MVVVLLDILGRIRNIRNFVKDQGDGKLRKRAVFNGHLVAFGG